MYKKILVPLDGSKRAEAILPHVEELAKNYHAEVIFLRVSETSYFVPDYQGILDVSGYNDEYNRRMKEAESYLEEQETAFRKKGINTKKIVLNGLVVQAILNTAEQENADIIAIASHGRTGVSRVFYGSVASGVLNGAERPLLIIRSKKE